MRFSRASSKLPTVKSNGKWPPVSVKWSPFRTKSNWLSPANPVDHVNVKVSDETDHVPVATLGAWPGSVMVKTKVLVERTSVNVDPPATMSCLVVELTTLTNSALVAFHVPMRVFTSGAVGLSLHVVEVSNAVAARRIRAHFLKLHPFLELMMFTNHISSHRRLSRTQNSRSGECRRLGTDAGGDNGAEV